MIDSTASHNETTLDLDALSSGPYEINLSLTHAHGVWALSGLCEMSKEQALRYAPLQVLHYTFLVILFGQHFRCVVMHVERQETVRYRTEDQKETNIRYILSFQGAPA